MISFYPGPSKVIEKVPKYVKDAYQAGILSANHRSEAFMQVCDKTISLLKSKLDIPDDYTIVFTSSATECWEIIAQSLITNMSYHFYNGAFGEKWFNYTKKIQKNAVGYRFDPESELKIGGQDLSAERSVICITQNETSNGTQVSNKCIKKISKQYPEFLIAIDATSSLGGIKLDYANADIWYASVQKCLGLPAGLGIMVCSPKAVKYAEEINENQHYNSLNFILSNIKNLQTPYTPNVLNIYLLMRMLEDRNSIDKVSRRTIKRHKEYCKLIQSQKRFVHLVSNKNVQSHTVLALKFNGSIPKLKEDAEEAGLMLGNGYGSLKESTVRIANFPAIRNKEIAQLKSFLLSDLVQGIG